MADYDLNEPLTRRTMIDLHFVCKVAGKRYQICPDDAALCRNYKEGFFGSRKTEKIHLRSKYDFLVQANARCFSSDRYSFGDMP